MVTIIKLENMEFRAYHGCYELEKIVGNNFSVDLTVESEIGDAAQRDDISSTVSYLDLFALVRSQMEIPSDIIENVAHRIIESVYAAFPNVIKVTATVAKLAPPLGGKIEKVSATLTR